ncbi:MAG: hypothetical protein AAGA86_10200 [Bacteroidota bacterium]
MLGRRAGSRAGVLSTLVGVAALKSMANGCEIQITDLLSDPGLLRG